MEIKDNFLPKEEFKLLQNFMLGENCPWYFNKFTTWRPENGIDAAELSLIHI